jgi:metallophosphoesterase (TIGR03768 family)
MAKGETEKTGAILASSDSTETQSVTRRDFMKCSAGTVAGLCCGASGLAYGVSRGAHPAEYPIDSHVATTIERVLSFPLPAKPAGPHSGTGLSLGELLKVSDYGKYGYGSYRFGGGLPVVQRLDTMPAGYSATAASPARIGRLLTFFAITDIHITDKEAPNQLIYLQQADFAHAGSQTSIASPVMLYTTHVLDAAIQTVNSLHQQTPFDFGISLGDACNSTQFNEVRWYIDVIDGKVISPSSGAHRGAETIDYQKSFKAVGLDRSIPWYQVMGNHDHFWLGSVPVDADPGLGIRQSYISGTVWAVGSVLDPNLSKTAFPCLVDASESLKQRTFYMGVIDGSTVHGELKDAGPVGQFPVPPMVAADPARRSLLRTEWIQEFFTTATKPVGHGFHLVDRDGPGRDTGFACYSFVPKSDLPLKVIVLDDTQSEEDGSHDIHGHGFLDATRWSWLQSELAAGQAANQLMIIAAHVPIAVANIGSEVEWWEDARDPHATQHNAVSLTELVRTLQSTPNLLLWIAGHRHLNTVKAFLPAAGGGPENGFWQVETSSLRDFPQQFRTFEVYLNSDYSISIVVINVDPAVAEGTPAATSRSFAIAAQQIVQNDLVPNSRNTSVVRLPDGVVAVETMDPTRPQVIPSAQNPGTDPTVIYGRVPGVPYCASYNAELFKYLNPTSSMGVKLRKMFPSIPAAFRLTDGEV